MPELQPYCLEPSAGRLGRSRRESAAQPAPIEATAGGPGAHGGSPALARGVALAAVAVSLAWSYWPILGDMAHTWAHDPQYSHGFFVPLFALFLLWQRRGRLGSGPRQASAWGLALLLAGAGLRLAGTYWYLSWLEGASLLPSLAGVFVLAAGRRGLAWSWPAIAYLLLMVPLPYRLHGALAWPLQRAATLTSTFALQTLGLPAQAEGNVIVLSDVRIGVVEACSGLTMLVSFVALAGAVALVIRRPLWTRVAVVASAIPIALLANSARITVTGVLHEKVGPRIADAVFHEWGGWLMMPLALGLLGLLLWFLSRLFVTEDTSRPLSPDLLRRPDEAASGRGPGL